MADSELTPDESTKAGPVDVDNEREEHRIEYDDEGKIFDEDAEKNEDDDNEIEVKKASEEEVVEENEDEEDEEKYGSQFENLVPKNRVEEGYTTGGTVETEYEEDIEELESLEKSIQRLSELKSEECEIYKSLGKRISSTITLKKSSATKTNDEAAGEPTVAGQKSTTKVNSEAGTAGTGDGDGDGATARTQATGKNDGTNLGGYSLPQLVPVFCASGLWIIYCINALQTELPSG